MIILYRDKKGHFISKKSAKRRKPRNVISELRENNKSFGIQKGYYTSPKKLGRVLLPKLILKKTRRVTRTIEPPAPPRKRRIEPPISGLPEPDVIAETYDEFEEDELADMEAEWDEEWEADYDSLDYMNSLDDYLEDENEWYEEA
jgi:hypothetical protein